MTPEIKHRIRKAFGVILLMPFVIFLLTVMIYFIAVAGPEIITSLVLLASLFGGCWLLFGDSK